MTINELNMKISYATISKTGRRSKNEDALRVIDMPEKGRWMGIVCDGMGVTLWEKWQARR